MEKQLCKFCGGRVPDWSRIPDVCPKTSCRQQMAGVPFENTIRGKRAAAKEQKQKGKTP